MNLGGREDMVVDGVAGEGVDEEGLAGEDVAEEGVGVDYVGEEGVEDVAEEGVGGEDASEEGEDQSGAMCADTPSCFDCGRVFSSWQGVNIHSRTCS